MGIVEGPSAPVFHRVNSFVFRYIDKLKIRSGNVILSHPQTTNSQINYLPKKNLRALSAGLFCGTTADRGISPRPEGMVNISYYQDNVNIQMPLKGRLSLQQTVNKSSRIELQQVLHSLAHSGEQNRDFQFLGDGQHYAALGGAVQLGENYAVYLGRLGK